MISYTTISHHLWYRHDILRHLVSSTI